MSTSVSSVVSHFPDAENGFTTTTAGSVASGAATVTLNSVAGYTNGEPVVLVIDPTDAAKKQTFTGIVDTSGVQITSVVWTAGTNQSHALGATVVDYATATHIAMMSKGIKVNHTQKGNHKTLTDDNANEWIGQTSTGSAVNYVNVANSATGNAPVISALGDDSNVGLTLTPKGTGAVKSTLNYDPWVSGLTAPSTITALGNRSYTVVINSTDYTDRLSPGTRLRTTRTVAAPNQCTSLNGTTQYYSKASPNKFSFTDDFVVSAWIKVSSYAQGSIASCYNGTSGWWFRLDATGTVTLVGLNAGAANFSQVTSYQSVPLNKWVHVTAQLDMSTFTATTTTSYVMIDGVDVPAAVSRGGTNPTALIQAGNLNIGAHNGGSSPFPGKIAQVAIYNAKVTQANILATISQGLAGTETSLASAYSFNNSIADLNTTTPNDLTAQGSAVATNADSPFGGQAGGSISTTLDYGIVTAASFSTNTTLTVQVPEGCTIPTTGGVTALAYSAVKAPYGMPVQRGKWVVQTTTIAAETVSFSGTNTWTVCNQKLTVPVGSWTLDMQVTIQLHSTVAGNRNGEVALGNSTYHSLTNGVFTQPLIAQIPLVVSSSDSLASVSTRYDFDITTAAVFTTTASITTSTGTETYILCPNNEVSVISASLAYL